MIVLGLGSGRTGTASLSHLFNAQEGVVCFHELNPTGAVFAGNPQPIVNTINEFQAILDGGDKKLLALDYARPASVQTYTELQAPGQTKILGDIAFYYLRYVEDILSINQNVRFVCIKRDRSQTVSSWMQKSSIKRWPSLWLADRVKSIITRTPFHTSRNYWQEHDGSVWKKDLVWDKVFPKFEAATKEEAIGMYWDHYYEEAERLAKEYPVHFRVFPIENMSNREGQIEILAFAGIPEEEMVLKERFHAHKSAAK